MTLRRNVVEYAYECNRCQAIVEVPSHNPPDLPPGYHLHIRRVTQASNHYAGGPIFLCSKQCLVEWAQYGISSSIQPIEKTVDRVRYQVEDSASASSTEDQPRLDQASD